MPDQKPNGSLEQSSQGVMPAASSVTPLPSSESVSAESQATFPNLAALSNMPPEQITEILKQNPQLRDFVVAAVAEAQKSFGPT